MFSRNKAIKTVGIVGGRGAFGSFLAEQIRLHAPWLIVRIYDPQKGQSCDLPELLKCGVVIFAVPPRDYEALMRALIPELRGNAILVDVCTVKMHTVKLMRELAKKRPYICTHPMFGRQSFLDQGNSLRNLELVVCEEKLPAGMYAALEEFLVGKLGLHITKPTAEEHDRAQARQQLLPQHIGMMINRAGFAVEAGTACTVSGRHFYRAMEIVKGDAELFKQCTELNPFWLETLATFELAQAEHRLDVLRHKQANGTS